MKPSKKKLAVAAGAAICLLVAVSLSNPGRLMLIRSFSLIAGAPAASATPVTSVSFALQSQSGPEVEQRARGRHGWTPAQVDSVVRGAINFYERNGMVTRQARLTLYRKYPDLLRLELETGGAVEISGFNQTAAWKAGAATLTEEQARDIRAWLRYWPDRLFLARAAGARYQEPGRRIEHDRPASPGRPALEIDPPVIFDQAAIQDTVGPPPTTGGVGDRRTIFYYVNRADSVVSAARWLEPDDPRLDPSNRNTDTTDIRVDFSRWQQLGGVLWPFEVTHWLGGRVDFRIELSEVKANQGLPPSLFDKP